MANQYRGEIVAQLNDRQWTLCLTLGTLAELEAYFKVADLGELAKKLSHGRLSAKDIIAILNAGLKGGGHDISYDDIADMRSREGATGYARIVSDLLQASFGLPDPAQKNTNE